MSDDVERLAAAEANAARARSRLSTTLGALQRRVEPRRLSSDAKRGLADARTIAVREVRLALFRRPGVIAAAAVGVVLLLARRPIAALFTRRRREDDDDE